MLGDGPIVLMLLLGAGASWWVHANQARQRACSVARTFCMHRNWQLLDQTVALQSVGPRRTDQGWCWIRVYGFEFSSDGGNRHRGWLSIINNQTQSIRTELDERII